MNGNNITYDMDDFLSAERSHWSLKIQAAMLLFLDVTGLSPWHASNNKNNAPHSVPYTTLWRWKHTISIFLGNHRKSQGNMTYDVDDQK